MGETIYYSPNGVITKADSLDRVTYHKNKYGGECWCEFDKEGNRIVYDVHRNIIGRNPWKECWPYCQENYSGN